MFHHSQRQRMYSHIDKPSAKMTQFTGGIDAFGGSDPFVRALAISNQPLCVIGKETTNTKP